MPCFEDRKRCLRWCAPGDRHDFQGVPQSNQRTRPLPDTERVQIAFPLLIAGDRPHQPRGRVMETIVVEPGLNDPMATFLTTVLVSFVDAGGAELSWALGGIFAPQLGVCDAIWRASLEGRSGRVHLPCSRAGASAGHVRHAEAYPRLRRPEAVSAARSRCTAESDESLATCDHAKARLSFSRAKPVVFDRPDAHRSRSRPLETRITMLEAI